MQAYSDPKRENDPHALPDVEVFYIRDAAERKTANATSYVWTDGWPNGSDDEPMEAGWYWWSCFPGCLPDSDPIGPFETEAEALADAQKNADDADYDDDTEEEEYTPTDGDYTITPTGPLGGLLGVATIGGKFLGTFVEDAEARAFIRDRMESEQFFPNVWYVSDHGNWTLTSVAE